MLQCTKMTDRTKKILGIIGWEFIFLPVKVIVLVVILLPVDMIRFEALWAGGRWGHFVAFFIVVACYALAFLVIVWWPFHKYVYSRLSRRGKRRMWLSFAVVLVVASFMLFAYRAVDERMFPASKGIFRN